MFLRAGSVLQNLRDLLRHPMYSLKCRDSHQVRCLASANITPQNTMDYAWRDGVARFTLNTLAFKSGVLQENKRSDGHIYCVS